MKEIKLLDCTLRDGGFVNDWEFGYGNIINIFERLISSGVDVLEIGFLDGGLLTKTEPLCLIQKAPTTFSAGWTKAMP